MADEPTPGRDALDDLRFKLKQGDSYEQHLASRIEDGLDAQTQAWLVYRAAAAEAVDEWTRRLWAASQDGRMVIKVAGEIQEVVDEMRAAAGLPEMGT